MDKYLIKTTDLGAGWHVHEWSDGAMTIFNGGLGQRVVLSESSVQRLRRIFSETAPAT